MRFMRLFSVALMSALLGLAVVAGGCDREDSTTQSNDPKSGSPQDPVVQSPKPATQPIIPVAQVVDWCREHAMPESICVQCNASLAGGFKAKNDWCEQHNVPKSQDFSHHPELKEKFAAAFKAKNGKEPPAMEEE